MKYRIAGDGWEDTFVARSGPLGRHWTITDPDGTDHRVDVAELEEGVLRLQIGTETHQLTILPGNEPGQPVRFLLDDRPVELVAEDEIDRLQKALGAAGGAGGKRDLRAVMPGIIRAVQVAEGDTVEADQSILILEAMKMENEIRAPMTGTVVRIAVEVGKTVAAGELLAVIES